jgi:iron(III) transport system substrate-binding protein
MKSGPYRFAAALFTMLLWFGAPGGAQQGATVVFYASMSPDEIDATVKAFARRHPEITIQALRLTSALIPPRVITAQRAGRFDVDVISAGPVDTAELADSGALQRSTNAEARQFLNGTVDPNGLWSTLYMDTTVIAWNTARLKAANLQPPASFADLGKPEWSGRIGLSSSAFTWYFGLMQYSSSLQPVMQQIAANKPLFTPSHSVTLSELATGEFDVTPTVYGFLAEVARQAGQPIDWVNPKPLVLATSTVALAKNAPHPVAAKVFLDWLLSREAQQFLVTRGYCSPRNDVASNPRLCGLKLPYVLVRPPSPAQYNESIRQFRATFGIAG